MSQLSALLTNLSSTDPLTVPEPFNVVIAASGTKTMPVTNEALNVSRFRGAPPPIGELNQLIANGKMSMLLKPTIDGDVTVGVSGGKIGFYGHAPASQPATQAAIGTLDVSSTVNQATVNTALAAIQVPFDALLAKLKAIGLIP